VSAIGQKFHAECFTCFHCHKQIRSGLFRLENGEPYCDAGIVEFRGIIASFASQLAVLWVLLHFVICA